MTYRPDVREIGERIETLLDGLRASGDVATAAVAEALVGSLVELYGEGLRRLVAAWPGDDERLVADPLVESLLLRHGLHPIDVDERIERALDSVRPHLGSQPGGVEYLGVDTDGVAHLRLCDSRAGCASSMRAAELAIRSAVESAAPEVTSVDIGGGIRTVSAWTRSTGAG